MQSLIDELGRHLHLIRQLLALYPATFVLPGLVVQEDALVQFVGVLVGQGQTHFYLLLCQAAVGFFAGGFPGRAGAGGLFGWLVCAHGLNKGSINLNSLKIRICLERRRDGLATEKDESLIIIFNID
jgi:hypothetical protein